MAHERLAIVDPDSGDQPLFNEDKTIVVTVRLKIFIHLELITFFLIFLECYIVLKVNGEIYNHEELRKDLKNHKFRTGSDCDVISHLVDVISFC